MYDDWLEHGHDVEGLELGPVLTSSDVLGGHRDAAVPPKWRMGWRGALAGSGIAMVALSGVAGVARAVQDNLFPSLGDSSPASVWQNRVAQDEPAPGPLRDTTTVPIRTTPTTTSTIAEIAPTSSPRADDASTSSNDERGSTRPRDVSDDPADDDRSGSSGSGSDRGDPPIEDDEDRSGSSGTGSGGSDDSTSTRSGSSGTGSGGSDDSTSTRSGSSGTGSGGSDDSTSTRSESSGTGSGGSASGSSDSDDPDDD